MAMAPCAPVGARWLFSLVVTLAFLATCHAALSGAGAARKLAQTNACSTSDVRRYFAGERNRNNSPCGRCGSGRVAWCCRSDEWASPDSCKPAGASCCSGPEFRYSYYDRDGDFEQDDLNDVWCMPASCTTNFRPPGSNAPTTTRAQDNNNNQQCQTRNDDKDHVGEYKRSQDPQRIAQNKEVCGRCAARNQRAWCCRSDDFASTDPLNCKPAKTGANCCDGNEYLYTDDDGDMDRMDDVWCLPATCRAT